MAIECVEAKRLGLNCRELVKPNSSEATKQPIGFQRPAVTMARAIKPLPADMFGTKVLESATERKAPAIPAIAPSKIRAMARVLRTEMPAASAASGCSPQARSSSPLRVE